MLSNKKNIAILMHGLAGSSNKYGTGAKLDVEISKMHFVENIISQNPDYNIDIFMHSWSIDNKNILIELYNPISCIFEEQIHFDFEYTVGNPNLPMNAGKTENGKFLGIENIRFHSLFSRWYSAKVVNDLKNIYSQNNNINYDYVMLTRFDLAYNTPIKFNELDNNKFYIIPPISNHGIHDIFFISNTKNIDILCQMFNCLIQVKHFETWNVHSHYLVSKLVNSYIGFYNVGFIGPDRLWDAGASGSITGPAPLVRDYYNFNIKNKEDPMEFKQIDKIKKNVLNECRQFSNMNI